MSFHSLRFVGLVALFCVALGVHAKSVTQEYAVTQVDAVEVRGIGTLVITQGNSERLTIVGESDALAATKVDLTNNRLTISSDGNASVWRDLFSNGPEKVEYRLQVRNLQQLKLSGAVNARVGSMQLKQLEMDFSGAANVEAENLKIESLEVKASGAVNFNLVSLQATNLHANFSGAGNLNIKQASRAENVELYMSGASKTHAKNLVGGKVVAYASGAAHISVIANEILDANASGASNIEYGGTARAQVRSSGVSHVNKF